MAVPEFPEMFLRSLPVRASVLLFVAIATAGAALLGLLAQ